MDSQKSVNIKGASMRLGAYPCAIKEGTRAREVYGKTLISERHRHRFEVNNTFREELEKAGLVFSGTSPDGTLAEMIELKDHPWFIGVQFHPEFQSTPKNPHPLFREFVAAAKVRKAQLSTLSSKVEKRATNGKAPSISAAPTPSGAAVPVGSEQ
jgi:CTP synthase